MLAETVVWCVFQCDEGAGTHLAIISPLTRERQPCFTATARVSMRRRCTDGHSVMPEAMHACAPTGIPTGSASNMRHECALALGSHSSTAMRACVMRLFAMHVGRSRAPPPTVLWPRIGFKLMQCQGPMGMGFGAPLGIYTVYTLTRPIHPGERAASETL